METTSSIAPFQTFTDDEIAAIWAAGRTIEAPTGEVFFQQGEVGDSMFLLELGTVELHFLDGSPAKTLGPGDLFGELAFITGRHARTATARAGTPCRLRLLDEAAAEALFQHHPRLLIRLLRRTCDYLLASEERLIQSLRERNQQLEQTLDYLRRTREEVDYHELLANTDELTGLYNRRCFDRQLAKFIQRSTKTGSGLALLLVDLDNLKQVNDTLGHAIGDDILRGVAATLASCVRSSDLPCRFGGDEFAVVLPEIERELARERAESIRRRIEEMWSVSKRTTQVTASIGGTMLRRGETSDELFERADQRLYRAKEGGRNRVVWQEAAA